MSDPNIEPTLGEPEPSTSVPDTGASEASEPDRGAASADPAIEPDIDITEAEGPDLQAGADLS